MSKDYKKETLEAFKDALKVLVFFVLVFIIVFISTSKAEAKSHWADPPTAEEQRDLLGDCWKKRWCRWLHYDVPLELEQATIGAPTNCSLHSEYVRRILGRGELRSGYQYGSHEVHMVLVVDGKWVIDNGTLARGRKVFPLTELSRLWTED